MSTAGSERGIALLLVLLALGGVAAILTSAFLLARDESRAGLAALARVQAEAAAEAALTDALNGWDSTRTPDPPGEETRLVSLRFPGSAEGTATVRWLGGTVYRIRSSAVRRTGSGTAIAFVEREALVLLDSAASGRVSPRVYPRGWRILP